MSEARATPAYPFRQLRPAERHPRSTPQRGVELSVRVYGTTNTATIVTGIKGIIKHYHDFARSQFLFRKPIASPRVSLNFVSDNVPFLLQHGLNMQCAHPKIPLVY